MSPDVFPKLSLVEGEVASLESDALRRVSPYKVERYEEFISSCQAVSRHLPDRVFSWAGDVKNFGAGLIQGLPIDKPLPRTPTSRSETLKWSMLSDNIIGVLSALFGTVYFFGDKVSPRHIQDIYPIEEDRFTQLAGASSADLEWHVEDAFLMDRPHWIFLLCLRNHVRAETKIARAKDLELSDEILKVLFTTSFDLKWDETFQSFSSVPYVTTSVLEGSLSDPRIVFDPPYTRCAGEEAERALKAVVAAAERAQHRVVLCPGDLLVINNRRVLHGRGGFEARMDGNDRWIKRALVSEDSNISQRLNNGFLRGLIR